MKLKRLFIFVCLIGVWGCASIPQMNQLALRIDALESQQADLSTKLAALQKDKKRMRAELDAYRKSNGQAQQEIRGNTATLSASVDELRKNLQVVTGKLEEADYSMQKSQSAQSATAQEKEARLDQMAQIGQQNQTRIANIEQYLDLKPPTNGPSPSAGAVNKHSVGKRLSEKDLYEAARKAFDSGRFETAREHFLEFLKRFPKSKDADNAQFWIGEIYYREKWYQKAIMEYQKVIESYPNGNKVPAALLKQGLAFYNLGEKSNARLILKEMIRKYSKSNEAKIARKELRSFH